MPEQPSGEVAELKFVEEAFESFVVARDESQVLPGDGQRHVGDDGGQFFGQQCLIGVGLDVLALFAFELGGVG